VTAAFLSIFARHQALYHHVLPDVIQPVNPAFSHILKRWVHTWWCLSMTSQPVI